MSAPCHGDRYWYEAEVLSAYDGDTLRVTIDLGFGLRCHNVPIRLLGVDTPEVRGAERARGLVVRDHVRARYVGQRVLLRTHHDQGKYGRYLGHIYLLNNGVPTAESLSDELLRLGYAVPYKGRA